MGDKGKPTAIGQLITKLRTDAGLSQYALAIAAQVNRSTLMRLEEGTTSQPTVDLLNALARTLDVDPEELYDAVWQDTKEPLPSPAVYFRSKYKLSAEQVAELEAAVESVTTEHVTKKTTERRSP